MKWFFKMGVATALTVSMTTTAFGAMQIKASDWAISSMEKAYELALIPEELLSRGTENMTRQEFAKMAIQFYQKVTGERINIDNVHNPFWDTDQAEIVFAYSLGIITGKQEHIFEPDSPLTREQMAIMIIRTLEKSNVALTEKNEEINFKDIDQLEKDVLPYIKRIQMAGIMNGFEDMFLPFKEVTVEEAVVAFTAMYESLPEENKENIAQKPTEQIEPTENIEQQIIEPISNAEQKPSEQTEPTSNTEQKPNEQAEQTSSIEQKPTEQTKQTSNTEQKSTEQTQQEGIVIDGKSISIGQSVSKLKADWGSPDRIDQNSYSLERYVYINDYKHFFMVSIKDNKVAEIFTNDMTFRYKEVTGKMDANDIKNVRYLDLKNFRAELQDENKDTFVLLNKDYKAEGILIRASDYKQNIDLRYSQQFLDNFKTELIDIINSARAQENGGISLTSDETAENVAYYHSWDMSKNNYVGYTNQEGENPFDRMTAGGVKYTMAGESVVKIANGDAIDAYHHLIMEAGTRTNILNPELTHYGLAIFDSNFTIYVTLDLFTPAKE